MPSKSATANAPVVAVLLALLASLVVGASPAAAAEIPVIRHGLRTQPVVALTFDDCDSRLAGVSIREILSRHHVHATLFCRADALAAWPHLWQRYLADGDEFGNHTIDHPPDLTALTEPDMRHEICDARPVIDGVLGTPSTNLMRPPGGRYNDLVRQVAAECGYEDVVLWDVDTRDWTGIKAAEIATKALAGVEGSIVLMHIRPPNTAHALRKIIEGYRRRGFTFVTVSELLAASP